MDMNNEFPARFTPAADFSTTPETFVIESVVHEQVFNKDACRKERKPIMYVVGLERGIVLNKTRNRALIDMFGPESDDWLGQQIGIARGETDRGKATIVIGPTTTQQSMPHQAVQGERARRTNGGETIGARAAAEIKEELDGGGRTLSELFAVIRDKATWADKVMGIALEDWPATTFNAVKNLATKMVAQGPKEAVGNSGTSGGEPGASCRQTEAPTSEYVPINEDDIPF